MRVRNLTTKPRSANILGNSLDTGTQPRPLRFGDWQHPVSTIIMSPSLIQYVVVRKDLLTVLKWPVGAVIAQACHACSAIMHLYHDDEVTKEYTADLDGMHKCVLEVRLTPQSMINRVRYQIITIISLD